MDNKNLNSVQVDSTPLMKLIKSKGLNSLDWKDSGEGKLVKLGRQLVFSNSEKKFVFENLYREPGESRPEFFQRESALKISMLREGFRCRECWIGKVIDIEGDLLSLTMYQSGEMDVPIIGQAIEDFEIGKEVNILGKLSESGYCNFLLEVKNEGK